MTYWLIAAVAVLIVEMFVGTIYLLVVSASLFGAALVVGFGGSFGTGILTAALLSAVGIALTYRQMKKRRSKARKAADDLDIGQRVRICRHLHDNLYEVHYRGTVWQAQAQHSAAGAETGTITGKNGNTLLIDFFV